MINLIKKPNLLKNKAQEREKLKAQSKLTEEIKEVCFEMKKTEIWFQMENNSDLIEACIHQREVLNARYRYLINKLKVNEIS